MSSTESPLYYEVHSGNGPYLLMVHGLLSCRAQWMLNLSALSRVARPVVVELFGHGASPAPVSPLAYRPEYYVEAFEKIRKCLNAERWLICGQSLGTGLTFRYALDWPHRIIGHIFTNATSSFREVADDDDSRFHREVEDIAQKILAGGPEGLRMIPIHPVHARRLDPAVKTALVAASENANILGIANALRYTRPELTVRSRLSENKVPSLLVCGEREKRFLPLRDYAREHMPLLDVVNVNAGHAVNIEAAAQFNESAAAFIRRLVR